MKKIIVVLLSLLMLMGVSGCSNGSSGISRGKMREIDPEEFTTLEYTAEVEGKGSALVTVDYEAMSEGLEKKLDSLYKEEYPDVYKTFKKMGFKPDLSNVLNIYADRKDELYNGDRITVHVTSGGDFSSYDIEDLLDALKIDMPTEYEMTVSGLREVEKIDITNGKDLRGFLKIEGPDGEGSVELNREFRLGSSVIKDKQGRTIYINEIADYSFELPHYQIVIDNAEVCKLTPMLNAEFIDGDTSRQYGKYRNGDKVGIYFYGADALSDYDLTLGSTEMYEIKELGSSVEEGVTVTSGDIDTIIEGFNEHNQSTSFLSNEPEYIFSDHQIYILELKPGTAMNDYGIRNKQVLFVLATVQRKDESYTFIRSDFMTDMYRYPDGSLSGTWTSLEPYNFQAMYDSMEEYLPELDEYWNVIDRLY